MKYYYSLYYLPKIVIISLHGEKGGFETTNQPPLVGLWGQIVELKCGLLKFNVYLFTKFKRHVGDGNTFGFWEENWLGTTTLKATFPRLYVTPRIRRKPEMRRFETSHKRVEQYHT